MKILSRERANFMPESDVWLVHSDIVGDDFRVCISAPFRALGPGERVGAVYATDGGLMAGMVTGVARACETQGELPQLFTVSIGYPLNYPLSDMLVRNRDLSPSANPEVNTAICGLSSKDVIVPSGGGDKFLAFLLEELRPALLEAFPIDEDDSTLVGASLGGLFTLHALLSQPAAFRNYLAMCPAIWWDQKLVLRNAQKIIADRGPAPKARLYMCAGEFESLLHMQAILTQLAPGQVESMPLELREADVQSDIFQMERVMASWGPDFVVRAKVQPDESHVSVMAVGLSQGLRWLFGTLKR